MSTFRSTMEVAFALTMGAIAVLVSAQALRMWDSWRTQTGDAPQAYFLWALLWTVLAASLVGLAWATVKRRTRPFVAFGASTLVILALSEVAGFFG